MLTPWVWSATMQLRILEVRQGALLAELEAAALALEPGDVIDRLRYEHFPNPIFKLKAKSPKSLEALLPTSVAFLCAMGCGLAGRASLL